MSTDVNSVLEIEGVYGFVGKQSGTIIALRNNGDEVLFVSKENAPLAWIKTEEFTADPLGLPTPEELRKAEQDPEEDFE